MNSCVFLIFVLLISLKVYQGIIVKVSDTKVCDENSKHVIQMVNPIEVTNEKGHFILNGLLNITEVIENSIKVC